MHTYLSYYSCYTLHHTYVHIRIHTIHTHTKHHTHTYVYTIHPYIYLVLFIQYTTHTYTLYIHCTYTGMHSYQGRGAPEIDILESMSGDEKLINTKIHRPYFSTSLQIAPGTYICVCLFV